VPTPNPTPPPAAAPLALALRVTSGNAAGEVINITEEFLIGRQAPGEGKLGNDIEISRRHARITREPDGSFVIEDLGSTNGTFVNGERVASRRLNAGDTVEMGDTKLLVLPPEEAPVPEPEPEPAPPAGVTTFAEVPAEVTEEAPPVEPEAAPEPEPEPEPEPVAEAEPEPAVVEEATADLVAADTAPEARGKIDVHLEVDLDSGEVAVVVDEAGGQTRFVKRDGTWSVE
jgi:pSer/pThr/pTyr-binding forkhead associated (FHA) protein